MLNRLLLYVLLIITPSLYAAEGHRLRRHDFSPEAGAPASHISHARQDETGFLWLATWDGLVRYDGYHFVTFHPVSRSGGTIRSNRIFNMRVCSDGNLWCISSSHQLYRFDRRTCTFTDVHQVIAETAGRTVGEITQLGRDVTWITFTDGSAIRFAAASSLKDYRFFTAEELRESVGGAVKSVGEAGGSEWLLGEGGAWCPSDGRRIDESCLRVFASGDNTCLLTTDGRLIGIDNTGRRLFGYSFGKTLNVACALKQDDKIVAATSKGVRTIDIPTGAVSLHTDLAASYLFVDSHRRIWCFGDNGVTACIADGGAGETTLFSSRITDSRDNGCNPQLIFESPDRQLLLKPVKGALSYYDEQTNKLVECRVENNGSNESYSPTEIKQFVADRNGNLWVFHESGTDYISIDRNRFERIAEERRAETRALAVDSRRQLWTADRNLHLRFTDKDSGKSRFVDTSGAVGTSPRTFGSAPAYCITESPEGDIWVGTKGDGLYRLHPSGREHYDVSHYRLSDIDNHHRAKADDIYALSFVEGKLWVGTYGGGLFCGEQQGGQYRFAQTANQPADSEIRAIHACGNGLLLLATATGLIRADLADPVNPRYRISRYSDAPYGLKGNNIMNIFACGDSLYACVFGVGISRIDSDDLHSDSLRFTTYEMTAADVAGSIKTAVSCDGNIWIVSRSVVSRFDPKRGSYATYAVNRSITLSEALPATTDSCIIIGATEGLLTFSPSRFADEISSERAIVVTGIRYQNDAHIEPINDTERLTFTPDKRSFTLFLSAMDFTLPTNVRFRYKMDGYETGWNYTTEQQPCINYNNIRPGEYTLLIEVTDSDGIWQAKHRAIAVSIAPRFVETFAFKMIVVLLVLAVVCLLGISAVYYKRMRNEIQRKYTLLMSIDELSRKREAPRPTSESSDPAAQSLDKDKEFIDATATYILDNIANRQLVVEDLARNAGMSRTAYYRRMKEITGLSPVDFIKQMRIKQALRLLEGGSMSVGDVSVCAGFSDPHYFARCFKSEMGMTPSQYVDKLKKKSETQ
jgi:AraC-like DNA-binding protein/ligand-binding sensor domain-containing protein